MVSSSTHLSYGLLPLNEWEIELINQYFYGYTRAPEVIAITILIIYIIVYIYGTARNNTIAQNIYNTIEPLLNVQFSEYKSYNNSPIKYNNNEYLIYCTGRRYIHSMLIKLQLHSRYDIITMISELLLANGSARDMITIDIALDNDVIDKYVVCVIKKKLSKQYKKYSSELTNLVTSTINDMNELNDRYIIYTDSNDASKQLVDKSTITLLNRYNAFIDYLHISDSYVIDHDSSTTNVIRLHMSIPNSTDELLVVIDSLLHVADRLHTIHLTSQTRSKNIEKREMHQRLLVKQQSSKKSDTIPVELTAEQLEKKQAKKAKKQMRVVR